jgi:hypothetical protein
MFPQFNVIESYARDFQPTPSAKPGSLPFPRSTENGVHAKFFSAILLESFTVIYFSRATYVDQYKVFFWDLLHAARHASVRRDTRVHAH